MKIDAIICTPFTVPLVSKKKFASGQISTTENVLVEIKTSDGVTGVAEAISRPMFYGESQRGIVAAIEEFYAPMLIGEDPLNLETIHSRFAGVPCNHTATGALDIALHDIIGQQAGISCRALLGNFANDVELTYMVNLAEVSKAVDEVSEMKETFGYRNFKLKTGVEVKRDIELIETMRSAYPDDLLYIDCNQGYDASDAIRVIRAAEGASIAWIEEPCPTGQRGARAHVAASTGIPILGDESCRTLDEFTREALDRTISMVSIKVARTGYYASKQILAVAAAVGIRPLCGTQGETGIGTTAAYHFCAAHKATRDRPIETFVHALVEDILAEPIVVRGGKLALPDRPGLGIQLNRKTIQKFAVM